LIKTTLDQTAVRCNSG